MLFKCLAFGKGFGFEINIQKIVFFYATHNFKKGILIVTQILSYIRIYFTNKYIPLMEKKVNKTATLPIKRARKSQTVIIISSPQI